MYLKDTTASTAVRFNHAATPRRTYSQAQVSLRAARFGGGRYWVICNVTGRWLGEVERTKDGWWAMSGSRTYQSCHQSRADAVLALASYCRMRSASPRQLRYAKATRALVVQMVEDDLGGLELLTFRRFLELEPKCQIAPWWLRHRRLMAHFGWEGFKGALRSDGLTGRFMDLYKALKDRSLIAPAYHCGPAHLLRPVGPVIPADLLRKAA
jgi:hypothetical protein